MRGTAKPANGIRQDKDSYNLRPRVAATKIWGVPFRPFPSEANDLSFFAPGFHPWRVDDRALLVETEGSLPLAQAIAA